MIPSLRRTLRCYHHCYLYSRLSYVCWWNGQRSHFGFFFRKAFEGGTTFGFLIGLVGFFGTAACFFGGVASFVDGLTTDGVTGIFGGAFDVFWGSFFTAVADLGGTADLGGLLATGFSGGDFSGGIFFSRDILVGFAAGVVVGTLGGAFGGGSGLASLTGAAAKTGAGIAGCTEGDAAKTGGIQLRLTASESMALNCDSNSGASGTS